MISYNLKIVNLYTAFVCYLLHFSTAVLYLIDCCTALHNCSNARVRYKITCWYSNRKKPTNLIGFLPIRIPTSYFVSNSRIRTIMQCSAAVNEIQHSRGEVQQIAHKGSIQINDLNCKLIIVQLPIGLGFLWLWNKKYMTNIQN